MPPAIPDVFVSYKREDAARVAPIVDGLRRAGLDVWWDGDLPGGSEWRSDLDDRLASARCVVVVWSERSAGPDGDFVQDEAARAKARGVLLPVRIDPVMPPLGFGGVQSLDLVGWSGRAGDIRFENVVDAISAIVQGGPRARPRFRRRRLTTAAVAAAVAATLAVSANLVGLQRVICRVPGVRTGCAAVGVGGVATRREEQVWMSRARGDCEALRGYLKQFPTGAYAAEAHRRLAAVANSTRTSWIRESHEAALEVSAGRSFASEDAARADALARAPEDAELACAGYKSTEFSRLKGARPMPRRWNCSRAAQGIRCGFAGTSICDVEMRHDEQTSICE